MSRISLKSAALPVVAFCWALHCAGLGTSTAQAGCGDYVHLGGGDTPMVIPGMPVHHARPAGPGGNDSQGCQGPHCRQSPATPDAPVPSEPVNGPDQKACLVWHEVPMITGDRALLTEPSVRLIESPHGRIDRPPRSRG